MTIEPPGPLGLPPSMHYAQKLREHLGADDWQHSHIGGFSTVIFQDQDLTEDDIDLPHGFDLVEIEHLDGAGITDLSGTLVRTRHP